VNQVPPPDDALEVAETLAYLEACHLIFERGFLSHDKISSLDCEILTNITKGYKYFTEWLNSLIKKGKCTFTNLFDSFGMCFSIDPKYPHTASTQRSFLAWQSECTKVGQANFIKI